MTAFDAARFPAEVSEIRLEAMRATWLGVARAGTWWTGEEKVCIAAAVRDACLGGPVPPWLAAASPSEPDADPRQWVARRLATHAGSIDRAWAERAISCLGDGPYVELVAVVASVVAVDVFCEALGVAFEPLPEPLLGHPTRERPDDVGDDGAYVPVKVPKRGPNVARALSLVPEAVRLFFGLEVHFYAAGADFEDLSWRRPLSRPQVELLAARTSALNECFY